ncbi:MULTISPECIES: hypothetical protein [unclassified Paenibacillus]|uniref:hypothetical protein n=1 Tax=unclassified Paenibacillus TaxID=185978 RepID=UPI0003E1C66E|nr:MULTISPECIES: hypothetical protein [unclassified Paenibacillus]ETT47402.1 hypothetical protein C162_17532 [Paenibacillus sp. FSL R7-269]OMF98798.1 hypothetical protein BK147_08120 [Paenibacillus sp. FSL R7-0337]
MTGKDRYTQIEIPAQLGDVLVEAQNKAAARSKRTVRLRWLGSAAAALIACLLVLNIPDVASALSKVPVVGSIVKVLQFGSGGERTDGAAVSTVTAEDTIRIVFNQEGNTAASVPSYTVDQREAPNRLIFTFGGVRSFDYDALEQDMIASPLVSDVYRNIILDDSAMRFVVELKEGTRHTLTEFSNPGTLELKLTAEGKAAAPKEVYYVRSEGMPQGESLAILEEVYLEDDVTFLKTASGDFAAVIGGFATREEAEQKLAEITARENYAGDLHVDSWMSNGHPE